MFRLQALTRTVLKLTHPTRPLVLKRPFRRGANNVELDPIALNEARDWKKSATVNILPLGQTVYSRSSGPGGQHVNKCVYCALSSASRLQLLTRDLRTESKATTTWSLDVLLPCLPKVLHSSLKESKYYVKGTNSIAMQAQTSRSRDVNTQENHNKLFEEIQRIYSATVPGETTQATTDKYKAL
ncbi:uncharacterized protein PgNI_08342 [Pyricularia grisea]|uniref:Prokaryotic-type class I peptide chain release factors domain-containing protein n=1 Tax=Pyricularia grisea TaxID=148305 RepID=A0A6P8AWW8_PYRGI|nr:uncharacterized protein PgNI_08342 [Pyricularia grisea]TLD06687.1 hypothetical protein PgNI_08342 [Pyricularia grisea]